MKTWGRLAVVFCIVVAISEPLISTPVVTSYESDSNEDTGGDGDPIETTPEGFLSALTPEQSEAGSNAMEQPQHDSLETENDIIPSNLTTVATPTREGTTLATADATPSTDEPTTTTPRPLAQYEIQTNSLISQNNESINQLHLDMLRYETQLNLNTLETILPILEIVRRNMSSLLDTPHDSYVDFEKQSSTLEDELVQLEGQINHNRALQQKYSQVEKDTRHQMEIVQKSLGEIFNSQIKILSPDVALIEEATGIKVVRTEEEVREFFRTNSRMPLEDILTFVRALTTPETRILGYNLFLTILNDSGKTSPEYVNFVGDLHEHPELEQFQLQVPIILNKIFVKGPKVMEMRSYARRLALVLDTGKVLTNKAGRESSKAWEFHPVENTRYYYIVHSQTNQGIGVVDSSVSTPSDRFKRIHAGNMVYIKENPEYHWEIHPILTDVSVAYLKFINRATGLALDANNNADVYPHTSNDGTNQHWEL